MPLLLLSDVGACPRACRLQSHVTIVVNARVAPSRFTEFEQALHDITKCARSIPGQCDRVCLTDANISTFHIHAHLPSTSIHMHTHAHTGYYGALLLRPVRGSCEYQALHRFDSVPSARQFVDSPTRLAIMHDTLPHLLLEPLKCRVEVSG
jgi:antibiotic biosynthesis monooxygenase (ABM) superfamily enzyme